MGGYALGVQQAEGDIARRNARKDQLTDEQHALKRDQYLDTRKNYRDQYNALKDENGNIKPEYKDQADKLMAGMSQNEYDIGQLYDPIKAPGRLQQDWNYLREKIHGITAPKDKTPSSVTTQAPAMTLNTPAPPLVTPELPAYQQVTPALPSQGGSKTTTVPGVASTTTPGMTPSAQPSTPLLVTQSFGNDPVPGMTAKGNADLSNRPNIDNGDGTHSSTFSMSFGTDKGEVLVPGVGDGKTYPARQLRVLYTLPDGSQKWAVPGNQPHNWIAPERPTPQNNEALNQYQKTGKNFGTFEDEKAADAYGKALHEDQEKYGNNGVTAHPVSPSGNVTIPAGAPVTVTKAPPVPWAQGQVQKLKDAAMAKAQGEAKLLAAGAPLSAEQEAVTQAKAQSAARYANLQADMGAWDKDNPNAPKDDRNAQYNQLYQKWFGTTGKGSWKMVGGTITDPTDPNKKVHVSYSFNSNTNQYANADGTPVRPDLISTFTPDPTSSSANEQDYQTAVEGGYTGSRAQFRAEQGAKGRGAIAGIKFDPNSGQVIDAQTGKRYSRGDANLPPEIAKLFASQAETTAEKQQRALALVYARGNAIGESRILQVIHPDGSVTYEKAGDAVKDGAQSPAGIAFKTDAAMQRNLLGGGKLGQSILAFQTAAAHLDLLQQAADALNNGDIQFPNRMKNQFTTVVGGAAPTNFDAIRAAVAGEIAKTFSTSVTEDDKAAILATINNAQSPAQIYGAISMYRQLMNSKVNAVKAMGDAASQGLSDSFKGPWKLPANAPPAPKIDNKVLKDSSGQIVARSKGGQWTAP